MASPDSMSIAMVAGETSGDLLASRLLSGLMPQLPQARMHGIGGPQMAEYGFVSDWPMDRLAVRGLFEVLAHYREIKGIQIALRDKLLADRPAVFIGVDAPDFNLGLEKQLKNAGIPATYVGHPLAEVIPMEPDVAAARQTLGLRSDAVVIAILPGSRMSELKYNAVAFVEAAKLLAKRDSSLHFVAPMAGDRQHRYFMELLTQAGLQDVPIIVTDGQSHAAMASADAVLVASGTASLEVALFKKPMVIAYKMMSASWHVMRHMAYQPWIGLPNILARDFVVPELLQDAATPQALADALWEQLHDVRQQTLLLQRFIDMHHSLLRNTAQESAQAVMKLVESSGNNT